MAEREKRVRRCVAICAVLTVAAFMTASAGAQAKTVRVGSSLLGSFSAAPFEAMTGVCAPIGGCYGTPATWVQTQLSETGVNITSPVDGTVISYRLALADGTFAIQVIRLTPASAPYTGFTAGRSIAASAPTAITASGISAPIPAHLALKRGDSVGIRNFNDDFSDRIGVACCGSGGVAWSPPLTEGAPPQDIPFTGGMGGEIGLQATVRYCKVPDLEGKRPEAARKALTKADCRVGKLKTTKKERDRKEVVSQSVNPGKAVSDTKPINLGLSRKQG